jgi:hypothetical protein
MKASLHLPETADAHEKASCVPSFKPILPAVIFTPGRGCNRDDDEPCILDSGVVDGAFKEF